MVASQQKTEDQMTLTLIIHKMLINVKFVGKFHGNSVFLITTFRLIGTQLTGKLNASLLWLCRSLIICDAFSLNSRSEEVKV